MLPSPSATTNDVVPVWTWPDSSSDRSRSTRVHFLQVIGGGRAAASSGGRVDLLRIDQLETLERVGRDRGGCRDRRASVPDRRCARRRRARATLRSRSAGSRRRSRTVAPALRLVVVQNLQRLDDLQARRHRRRHRVDQVAVKPAGRSACAPSRGTAPGPRARSRRRWPPCRRRCAARSIRDRTSRRPPSRACAASRRSPC